MQGTSNAPCCVLLNSSACSEHEHNSVSRPDSKESSLFQGLDKLKFSSVFLEIRSGPNLAILPGLFGEQMQSPGDAMEQKGPQLGLRSPWNKGAFGPDRW